MNLRLILPLIVAAGLTGPASAKIVTKTVAYEHAGTKLQGYLAYDDERIPAGRGAPGVLVIPEWWGLNEHARGRAEMLAQLGYVAFAADMYGNGEVTTKADRAKELSGQFYGKPLMAERAQAGLDTLLGTGMVDAKRVAAIGFCFGGSTVQALAYSGAPLVGIVSFHGGLIPVPADAAEKNKARFLICHGGSDPFVSKDAVDGFLKSMNEGKFDYQFVIYSGAQHAFTNPKADELAAANGLKGLSYNAAADRRSWALMQSFFRELFGS
ncbi:MAG TPA: dienelactone hydrolase family protein [Candidatus Didemnitutus sp.]|nr:dienelactone hydrolase family protein [Candidatus Didemnitutus sp.]